MILSDDNIWNFTETNLKTCVIFFRLSLRCIVMHSGEIFKEAIAGLKIQ